MPDITEVSSNKVFSGWQKVYSHESYELGCKMNFGIFLPPQVEEGPVPVIYWLSGLTCTEANFVQKAGAQKYASEQGVILVAPDTSPRNLNIPGEDDDWDFGTGAGFYVDAVKMPWKKHYRMYSYVTKELPALINEKFPVLPDKQSIMGHSMGGHGALICALKNPGLYKTVSAFAPISNPISCPWGKKAFSGYLGGTETNAAWREWDATELVKKYNGPPLDILVDQGKEDKFLKNGQLLPENLLSAAKDAGLSLVLRFQESYDHSYFFISTFIEDHIKHHYVESFRDLGTQAFVRIKKIQMNEDAVKVAVRIRPLIKSENERGCQTCLDVVPGEPQIVVCNTAKAFTFNYVFPPNATQEEFYNTAVKSMVQNIFQGYNVTILAYGQTGSGKTHSMGTNYIEEEDMGIIPRSVNDIFDIISSKEDWSFKVTVSFMELYQEQLYDLLTDKQRNQSIVEIRDDGKNIKIAGLVAKEVKTATEALNCLTQGSLGRATGATAMNAQSSRSHAIYTLCVYQHKKNDLNTATTAKFHLVDLAGSERSKKTQATGERFKEGVNINRGLLALGNVISQLGEGGPAAYVGYRDSKLTRLLQDSLGGNSITLMIACVSPADYNLDETLSTLRYADRACKIKNKPVVNQDPQIAEINRLNKLVQELKLALVDNEIKVSCPLEHQELQTKNQCLQKKIRDLTEKLNSNLIEAVVMYERAELAEQAREKIQTDMIKILEESKKLLDDFDKDPNKHNEHRSRLEALYLKILDIQNDQKKTSEELIKISSDNANTFTINSEDDPEQMCMDEVCSPDSLDDFHEKQEEHTLLQAKRNDEVQNINKELAIKESLIHQLLKSSSLTIDYSKEIQEMEQEIKTLQIEKEELLQALQNVQANNAKSKLAENRRKKVQELEKKITELRRKISEQDRIVKTKEKQDQQIRNLSNEMHVLKQTRIKLIRQMRNESDRFTKWKESKEKELNRLKNQNRKQMNEVTRLKLWHSKQETVFKRKMEEAFAVNKRLKEALDLQKRVRKEKMNTNTDKIQNWLTQEIEISVSTIDAEYSLEKLMQDRASLACMLEKFQNDDDVNGTKIAELTEFLDLRNTQITDLQQKIVESDQESRAHTRWQKVHTMEGAKIALELLFKHVTESRRKQCVKEYEYNELQGQYELLQARLNEYRVREKERRMSKQLALNDTHNIKEYESEDNSKLREKLEFYKQKCEELEHTLPRKIQNKENVKPKAVKDVQVEDIQSETDDSTIEDDVEKDPDWTRTPLYNRIRNLLDTTKSSSLDRNSLKRTSDGDAKCNCKTSCATRICRCRKNKIICGNNCKCVEDQCQNRDKRNLNRTLFMDQSKEDEKAQDDEFLKKPRLVE